MAVFKTDLQDIYFNLFDVLKVQENFDEYDVQDLTSIVEEFNKFVENEIYPTRAIGDEEGVKIVDGKVKAPECFHKALRAYYENGWYALGQPEEFEGMPAPEAVNIACTSIGNGANIAFSMYHGLTKGAMNVIRMVGSGEQKQKYIPKMMSGEWGGTMCLTEAGAGSDVGAATTTAKKRDDGLYDIKGIKIFISSGESDLFENNIHMVLARTPGAPEGTKGLSLFIVPRFKDDGSSNDVVCTKIEHKMGIHAQATCELTFGNEGNCEGELIGKELEGIQNMFILMNEARLLCGIQGESAANLCFELTKQYAQERAQFGTEIHKMPDVKRMLLKMRAVSRGMRALNLHVANLFDAAHKGDIEAEKEIAFLTPISKAYCSDEGLFQSIEGVQIHGGYGYCSEYGIEQFIRDSVIARIYEGTNGIQANDFTLRKTLKDEGKMYQAMMKRIGETIVKASGQENLKVELELMQESLQGAGEIMQKLGKMAAAKNFEGLQAYSYDFMNYAGNLMVSWLLLNSALVANEKLSSTTSNDDKNYLKTKEVDFRIFCQHFLVRNLSLRDSILRFEEDLTSLEI